MCIINNVVLSRRFSNIISVGAFHLFKRCNISLEGNSHFSGFCRGMYTLEDLRVTDPIK